MRPARRRALIALAVLLPAALVYAARQVGAPAPAAEAGADRPPVFVGRVTPTRTLWSVGPPLRVTVEISADRPVALAGIRIWADPDEEPVEAAAPTVGPQEPRTVPFDVVFGRRGGYALVLQVRVATADPWTSLPPSAEVIVA